MSPLNTARPDSSGLAVAPAQDSAANLRYEVRIELCAIQIRPE
jgi:hypothetical protein